MEQTEKYSLVSMAPPETQLKQKKKKKGLLHPLNGTQLWNYVPTGELVNGWNVAQTSD